MIVTDVKWDKNVSSLQKKKKMLFLSCIFVLFKSKYLKILK